MSVLGLDPDYVIAPSLQMYFVDKDTGFPLAAGYVYFYEDEARTIPKSVFQISGTPPNYQYDAIPNPTRLSSVGTFTDGMGNDIIPYYYPFDADGNPELYYIRVYNSNMVFQFDREGWPNTGGEEEPGQEFKNFIPNGQFLIHENIPAIPSIPTVAGEITQPRTILAQGGFIFYRPPTSNATDIITFTRINSFTVNPTTSPRYQCTINTTIASPGDSYKDFNIEFTDVNKFSSSTQMYTFSVSGASNTGGVVNVQFIVIKDFGSGGSPTATVPVTTFPFSPGQSTFQASFVFGDNSAYTIGPNNDDKLKLILRFPVSTTFSVSFTDLVLTIGDVLVSTFPQTTDAEFRYQAIAGWMPTPDYNGYDLHLPLKLTQEGIAFDRSEIGKVVATISPLIGHGELTCGGQKYITSNYSTDGIPYKRLFNVIYNPTYYTPIFGSGMDYAQAVVQSITSTLRLRNNFYGVVSATADGATPTGFTFSIVSSGTSIFTSQANSYVVAGISYAFIIENFNNGISAAPNMQSSGFTFSGYLKIGTALVAQAIVLIAPSGSSITPGTYFNYYTPSTAFYVWFTINGSGSDPAPGGTGIKVNLLSTDSPEDVAEKVSDSLYSSQVSVISATGFTGASVPPGSYWTFQTTNGSTTFSYFAWYTVDGVGTEPTATGTGIMIPILSGSSAAAIAAQTVAVINSYSYQVPDLRGYFLRGFDPQGQVDQDLRYSVIDNYGLAGTYQYDSNQQHIHPATAGAITFTGSSGLLVSPGAESYAAGTSSITFQATILGATAAPPIIGIEGRYNSQPVNFSVNFLIKY